MHRIRRTAIGCTLNSDAKAFRRWVARGRDRERIHVDRAHLLCSSSPAADVPRARSVASVSKFCGSMPTAALISARPMWKNHR